MIEKKPSDNSFEQAEPIVLAPGATGRINFKIRRATGEGISFTEQRVQELEIQFNQQKELFGENSLQATKALAELNEARDNLASEKEAEAKHPNEPSDLSQDIENVMDELAKLVDLQISSNKEE
jgi:predicted AlkP superfamily phosphohydrolase/phosphomutase